MKHELTLNELIEAVKEQLDPYFLLEILDLPFDELVDYLRDAIEQQYDDVLEALDD